MKKTKSLLLLVLFLMSIISCRKSDRDYDTDTTSVAEYISAQHITLQLIKTIQRVALVYKGIAALDTGIILPQLTSCDTILVDTLSFPKKIIFNFKENCQYQNVIYQGKMTAEIYGKWPQPNVLMNITFDSFSIDDYLFGNMIQLKCTGQNNGKWNFILQTPDTIALMKNKKLFMLFSYWLLSENFNNTLSLTDDEIEITGKSQGITFKGVSYQCEITTSVRYTYDCRYPLSGTEQLKPGSLSRRIIDYGSGTCDNIATINLNSVKKEISF